MMPPMRTCRVLALAGVVLLCLSAHARAQPSFATLDRMDGRTRLGADLGYTILDRGSAQRLGLHGQGVSRSGFGGYGALAVSNVSPDGFDDESGVSAIEVGGLYVFSGLSTLRLGLILPTADSDDTAVNRWAGLGRLTDLVQSSPEATWLRASLSPIMQSGSLLFRADLGLDLPLDHDSRFDPDPLIRANLGLGVATGMVDLMAELVNVGTTASHHDLSERFMHTIAFSVRVKPGAVEPAFSLVLPLDSGFRGTVDAVLVFGVQYVGR
jgi:hypothetical protein